MIRYLIIAADLLKIRVALAVVLSTAVGYILINNAVDTGLFIVSAGVFLLASGSAALNHVQEYHRDLLMQRTANRPLPSGVVSRKPALALSAVLAITGMVILWLFAGRLPALLGAATLILYNAVYTPLKPVTPYALLFGGLVGAIPPAIGFTAAGGLITDTDLILLCLFFFIWQVPHFLLLLLRYGDDYLRAGFKTLNRYISNRQLSLLCFFWMVALAMSAAVFPMFGLITNPLYVGLLIAAIIALVLFSIPIMNPVRHERHIPLMFRIINLFMLLVAHLLMFENIF